MSQHILKQFEKPIIFVILAFILGYYSESLITDEDFLETFEILAELFTVFASFSIFAVTWYAYNKGKNNHSLFLGALFLVIGIFDLIHFLSYPFMPDFITANSHQKSIIFWSEARVVSALFFFASVYVYNDTFPKLFNKYVLFISATSITFLSFIVVLFYPGYLPLLEYPDGTSTGLREYQIILTAIIILYAGYLYSKRIKITGEKNLNFLIYGFIIATLSDLVYFDLELTGHLLKIIAFYYIFIALYETSVELPYEKLAIAEEKLRRSAEEKYHMLYESSSDAIMLLDEKGFFDCNNAALMMFGFSQKEDILKVHPSNVSPPYQPDGRDSLTASNSKISEAFKKGTSRFEWIHRRKNGRDFPADVLLTAFQLEGKQVLQATFRDISDRKSAESGLLLRGRIIETMAEGVYLIRVKDGLIVYTNPKFETMFGYEQGELLGRHVSVVNASTEKSSEETASEISRVLNEKGEWNGEVLNIRKDGTTFWCYANVSTFYHPEHGMVWIAVHTDITMIKKFREALQQSEERFRSTMQSAYDAIIVVDGKGNIILWNNGAKNIFGYSEEEVMGKPLTTMMPEKYRLAHTNMLEMVTSNGKSRLIGQILELYGLRKDGVEFPIELTIGTWMVGNDRFYSGIIRDISERKKSEELHQENMKLSYANKLKSEFLAIMSHELRTPLNAILGFSDLLLNKTIGEINEKQEKYIENIRLGGNRLLSTVDIILEMTKIEAGKIDVLFEKISVPQTVEECLILIKENAAKNKIILDTEFDQQTELIEADRQKLKMVLFNLLDNAVKFSKPEGGRVTIAVKKDGNMAKFSISDTGIGIKEEDLAGVFREFNQIDSGLGRRYGGIGLGLAISKRLVELHGGEIKAISKYGEGSTFTFTIPIKRI